MNVRMCLITGAIVSIVDTRLRPPTETLLKRIQAGMHLELYYVCLVQARPQVWVRLATFVRTT